MRTGCGTLAATVLSGCLTADNRPVTFGLVTDVHYADIDNAIGRHYREAEARLAACVREMNARKPDFLKGVNRHEMHPATGPATSESVMVQDIQLIKALGCNFIRLPHYPASQRFLDFCDEAGVLVWEESLGWGNVDKEMSDPEFIRLQLEQTDLMVKNSFNHPSVIIFAFMNELDSHSKVGDALVEKLATAIRKRDSGRLVSFATFHNTDDIAHAHSDVVSFNSYPGWIDWGFKMGGKGEMKARMEQVYAECVKYYRTKYPGKPILVSETGACGIYGKRDAAARSWSEDYEAEYVDNEKRWGFRKLTVDSLKDYGVTNGVAILAAAPTPDAFLAQVDAAEVAFGMPRGVQSRRDSRLNASIFWTSEIEPGNADEILALMKKGGFRMLLIYYPALIKAKAYSQLPDYRWDNGWSKETLSSAVAKFHANGISVGFHALQTFIGLESSYVTPEADHRLALAEHFKEKIVEYPYAAAKRLAKDFTRVDFGWWYVRAAALDAPLPTRGALINWEVLERSVGVQVDHWEYGTSKAAAFDSPATVQGWLGAMRANKRMDDILEMMRKWEDVRARKLLTFAQKEKLKDPKREFHLLDDGKGGYDLVEWKQLTVGKGPDATWAPVRAFVYARGGKRVVAYWHVADKGRLVLPDGLPTLEAENLKLWETDLTEAQLVSAFARATAEK